MTIIGLAVLGWAKLPGARYFGIFLANMGASGCVPGVLAFVSIRPFPIRLRPSGAWYLFTLQTLT